MEAVSDILEAFKIKLCEEIIDDDIWKTTFLKGLDGPGKNGLEIRQENKLLENVLGG